MTPTIALAITLALTAGAYTAGAIALLLGWWRCGNRAVAALLATALIAFAADRTYPPSLPYAAVLTVIIALIALFLIVRTPIDSARDAVWSLFVAVPAVALVLLASADSFAPDVTSTLRTTAVALFVLPGIIALVFYVASVATSPSPRR